MRCRRQRIYLDHAHTKYCVVRLYAELSAMQKAYERRTGNRGEEVLGACQPYTRILFSQDPEGAAHPEIATVFLCVAHCGAGIVSHELLHAALWGFKYQPGKRQYPIVIRSMKQEEELLHSHTYAVQQFYDWYFKVASPVPK